MFVVFDNHERYAALIRASICYLTTLGNRNRGYKVDAFDGCAASEHVEQFARLIQRDLLLDVAHVGGFKTTDEPRRLVDAPAQFALNVNDRARQTIDHAIASTITV